jgi:exosortase A
LDETSASPPALERGARAFNWPLHGAFVLAVAVFIAGYGRTFASLAYVWDHDGTFQYAFFIFPISAVVIWMRRDVLRRLRGVPAPAGLPLLAVLSLAWTLGGAVDINLVQHFCVVALIPVLVYTIYGAAIARALLFPLAYLFFSVPFGDFLVHPLQNVTAHLSVYALQLLTSIPVWLSGQMISTPVSVWHVAAACSGVKFFFATTAFGVLYANLFFQSWPRRVIFVVCAMVVPVIANGLRVFFTILIGETFGLHYATGTDHLIFGWQFFGTVLVLLFFAGWPWHETEPPAAQRPLPASGPRPSPARTARLAGAAIILFAFGPFWLYGARALADNALPIRATQTEAALAALASASGARFTGADTNATRTLGAGATAVALEYVRYDGPPESAHELIKGDNRIFDPARWQRVSAAPASGPRPPLGFHAVLLRARSGGNTRLLWYAYRVNGRAVASPRAVMAWQAWYVLTLQTLYSSVVILSTPAADLSAARARLAQAVPQALRWAVGQTES